jgi:chromate transporter
MAPTGWGLFREFARIGLTSFGGGLSGWLLRVFVQDKGWLTEEEFLNGLAVSQALPGVNVTNMAIWIGYRLLGLKGALASLAGILLPPGVVILGLGAGFSAISGYALTAPALNGAAAAAIGLSLAMGITTARRVARRVVPWALMVGSFVMIALLGWPLVWVVLALGAAGIGAEFLHLRGRRA